MTLIISENLTKIHFVLIDKEHQGLMLNAKAMPVVFQHALVVADINKKKQRNAMRKTYTERRKISLLIDLLIGNQFEEKVIDLVDVGLPNLLGHFQDGILVACNEVCWN